MGTSRFGHEALVALASREGPVSHKGSPLRPLHVDPAGTVFSGPQRGWRPLSSFRALPQANASSRSCSALPGFLPLLPLRPTKLLPGRRPCRQLGRLPPRGSRPCAGPCITGIRKGCAAREDVACSGSHLRPSVSETQGAGLAPPSGGQELCWARHV